MQLLFTAVFYVATGELSNLLPQLAYLQAHRASLEAASCLPEMLCQLCTIQSNACSCVTALQSYILTYTPHIKVQHHVSLPLSLLLPSLLLPSCSLFWSA